MVNQRFRELLDKYLTNTITESERDELFIMIQSDTYLKELQDTIEHQFHTGELEGEEDDELRILIFEKMRHKLTDTPPAQPRIRMMIWQRIAAAAAIVLFFVMGYMFVAHKKYKKSIAEIHTEGIKNDVAPGKYKAKLILANGQTIIIDSSTSGELPRQGNVTILRGNNQLIYTTKNNATGKALYNTLTTARGETYAMVLADGSKVWLNSLSSIKFPVMFTGDERRVEISGEVYFEIKHNARMPFKVLANGVEVRDLGTEFNLNDYSDEPAIKTTLVAGRAKVVKGEKNHVLDPGQEVQVKNDELTFIKNADIEQATAWKNGLFRFKSTDVESIMRQLARWYNVDVNYEGKIPGGHFSGIISHDVSLVEVLKMLELSGIHFKLNGTKLTVIP